MKTATAPFKKVLVAIDGSAKSLETIRYLPSLESLRHARLVLYHVFNSVPECYWDIAKEPKAVKVVPTVLAWQAQQEKIIRAYMDNSKAVLVKAGFPERAVKILVRNRKKGVARDILAEAREGYDALVMRRRGFTLLPSVIMGSVATKLVQKLTFIPVIVAGIHPPAPRFLIAFEDSPGAMRAVDFAGRLMAANTHRATLFHAIRGSLSIEGNQLYCPPEVIAAHEEAAHQAFAKARERLQCHGIADDRLDFRVVKNVRSRAAAIAEEAAAGNYGAIVIGRRGKTHVRNFFMGRVCDKVIHMAREHTVCIAS
jgi:nucleotide-binding universal stress UspA family protein